MKATKLFNLSALLLASVMALSACGGSGTSAQTEAPAASEAEKNASAQAGSNTPAPAETNPEVIYTSDEITISTTPVSDAEIESEYSFKIIVENKSPEPRRVSLENLLINGLQFPDYGAFYEEIEAGQTAEGNGYISTSELSAAGISGISSVEMSFLVMNTDYDTLDETGILSAPVTGGSGSGSYDISGSQVVLDADGVRLSYEGNPDSSGTLINLYFALENGTDDVLALYDLYEGEIIVNGTADSGDSFVNSSAPEVLAQKKAFGPVSVYVPGKDVSAVDFTMQLFAMNDSIPTYLIPMHISLTGNAVGFAFDAPEYDPDWAERHAAEESMAAEEESQQQAEQAAAEALANAVDPEIAETAFNAQSIGNNKYFSNDVIAMLHNPNDNVYFTDIKVKFTLFDADGNILGEEYNYPLNYCILGPGETIPVMKGLWDTDIEPSSIEAVLESAEPLDMEMGRYFIEEGSYAHLSDHFTLDDVDIRLVEVFNTKEYHISGHVTNNGEESGNVILQLNFLAEDGTLLYGTDTLLKDVPANGDYDFDQVLGHHELPEFANMEVRFIAKNTK